MTENKKDVVETALDKAKPFFAKLTFGSIMGYCSGYASKKVGKAVALAVGVGFILVQTAAYSGYIDVDWKKVKNDAQSRIDMDGDGEITTKDYKEYWKKIKGLLTYNLGSSAGFSLGFLYGVRYG